MPATKPLTRLLARRINASLMQEITFIDRPGCGVTAAEWLGKCASARDLGVALYPQVIRAAKRLDATFTAPEGDYDAPRVADNNR